MPGDLLALHTSDAVGAVAVSCGERLGFEVLDPGGQHARSVLGAVRGVLARLGVGLQDLRGLVVTTGPGSFTGIRIGLATAQGLAAARGWTVLACDSLKAEATAHLGSDSPVGVVLDARRGEVYAALYDARGDLPREQVAPFCASAEEAAGKLAAGVRGGTGRAGVRAHRGRPRSAEGRLLLVGSGVDLVRGFFVTAGVRAECLARAGRETVVRALLDLARAGGCPSYAPEQLEPEYLRRSDAEIRRQRSVPDSRGDWGPVDPGYGTS
ncbi:MAG: tRNA (adenosine(37)-N6)-threonylcarbamoyltransferase complex dimerization subunit type 1 TsaB [Candidatus Krumholzibacteriia bacterium]